MDKIVGKLTWEELQKEYIHAEEEHGTRNLKEYD